jgi:hypothetical protein
MTETHRTIITVLLGAAGVAAEVNLARIFIKDWLIGRREERGRKAARAKLPTRGHERTALRAQSPESPIRLWPIAAAVTFATAPLASAAPGSDPPEPTDSHTLATTPTLSLQPNAAAQPAEPPPAPAEAKPLTISTDRPGFSDTTGIAPVGHLQLETGYTFTFRNRDGVETQTHNAPELLARVGLIDDRLEVRIGTSGYVWSRSDAGAGFESVEGFSDGYAGIKLKLIDQDGAIPRLALEAITTLGLGSHDISNRDAEPTGKLIASWDLGSGFSLTANGVMTYATTSGSRFIQGAGSASLWYTASDHLSMFLEYFVIGPRTKGSDAAHSIDFGGAYLINNRLQLDARVGFGLNREADNFFVGVGVSFLF